MSALVQFFKAEVAQLPWVVLYQLHRKAGPEAIFRFYGLSTPELLHLAQDLGAF